MSKILFFEDDIFLRGMYVTKYIMEGFVVAAYENPTKDPVSIVLKEKPDFISMDILMPVMNGFDATKLIKADPRTKNIPLVFLTNLNQQADIDKGRALGGVDYLVKANHMPTDVINRTRTILGLPIPAQQKDVPRELLDRYIVNPTRKPVHATPDEVTKTVPTARKAPLSTPVKPVTISRWVLGLLIILSIVGVVSSLVLLFSK
jgi:CheY-like chemotaxis protein